LKKVFILLLTLIFLFSLASCGKTESNELRTVQVNEVTHSIFYAPFYAAISQGFFEEEGLTIELTNGGGSDKSMTALLTGQADIGLMGPETAVYVAAEGRENYAVIFAQLTQRDGSFLLGKEPDEDFDWSKLEGRSVIGGRSGGMPEMTLEHVLREKGFTIGDDLTLRTDVQYDLMGGAFISGDDDYVTMFEPSASAMEKAGEGYIVASVGEAAGEIPYTCFMSSLTMLKNNQKTVEAFTRAVYKGQLWVLNSDSKTVAKALLSTFPDSDLSLLATVIDRYREIDVWKHDPIMKEDAYQRLCDIIREAGVRNDFPSYSMIVNTDIARSVIREQ